MLLESIQATESVEPASRDALETPVSELSLSVRSYNCLRRAGISTVRELLATEEGVLLKIKGFGRTCLQEIRSELARLLSAGPQQQNKQSPAVEPTIGDSSKLSLPPRCLEASINELGLSTRSLNCLKLGGITSIKELVSIDKSRLLQLKALGRKSLNEIETKLHHFLSYAAGLTQEKAPSNVLLPSELRFRNRALRARELYDQLGTYETVGQKLGITRERVRQIIQKGERRGWLEFVPKNKWAKKLSPLNPNRARESILRTGSVARAAKVLGMPADSLRKWCESSGLDVQALRQESIRQDAIERYKAIVQELGYHPSTTVLQRKRKWRATWAKISRIWGSFNAFRRSFGIKPKLVTERPWLQQHRRKKKKARRKGEAFYL